MSLLASILGYAADVQASDGHLVAGQRPIFRQNGELVEGGEQILKAVRLAAIVEEILPGHVRDPYRTGKEAGFAGVEPGIGRSRANAFFEEGGPTDH
jgi:twitching motility protein PilT